MKYSVITINYNHREGLKKTIESVINQNYKNFEYIVIDGGSKDGSKDIIEKYADHINFWVSEPDKGIYNAMNKGIKMSHGEYLIFMNSGDLFFDNKVLERSLPYMHEDIVQGVAKNHDLSETPLCFVKIQNRETPFTPSLHHQSCFFKKELFDNSLYDENYKIVADWKFYIEQIILYNCTYKHIPVTVAIYEGGGISDNEKETEFNERKDILKKLSDLLNEKRQESTNRDIILHLMFSSKQRFLLNKKIMNVKRYIDTFPEANSFYKYYPFNWKQKLLFILAEYHMTYLLELLVKIIKK